MPALIPVMACTIFLTYWVDKWYLIKTCKRPPALNARIDGKLVNMMFIAVFIHCIWAIWTYTNVEIFPYPKKGYGNYVNYTTGTGIYGYTDTPVSSLNYEEKYFDRILG